MNFNIDIPETISHDCDTCVEMIEEVRKLLRNSNTELSEYIFRDHGVFTHILIVKAGWLMGEAE